MLITAHAIGNFATSEDDTIIETLMQSDILNRLYGLLLHQNEDILLEALWCLSNIACAENQTISSAFIEDSIFSTVVSCMDSHSLRVRKEALLTVCNAITSANADQVLNMLVKHEKLLSSFMRGLKFTSDH